MNLQYLKFLSQLCLKNVIIFHGVAYRNDKIQNKTAHELAKIDIGLPSIYKCHQFIVENKDKYMEYVGNVHHWTTSYCWKTVIPLVLKSLYINHDQTHFKYVQFIWNNCDFSYHDPINDKFEIHINNKTFTGDENVLRNINRCPQLLYSWSLYHMLCIFAHECGRIKNLTCKNNYKLALNCDSMSIPLIPILAHYFKEIIVIDKRTTNSTNYINTLLTENITHYASLFIEENWLYRDKYITNLI